MRNIFENLHGLMGFGVRSVGIRAASKQKNFRKSELENQKKSKNNETEYRNFTKKFENPHVHNIYFKIPHILYTVYDLIFTFICNFYVFIL